MQLLVLAWQNVEVFNLILITLKWTTGKSRERTGKNRPQSPVFHKELQQPSKLSLSLKNHPQNTPVMKGVLWALVSGQINFTEPVSQSHTFGKSLFPDSRTTILSVLVFECEWGGPGRTFEAIMYMWPKSGMVRHSGLGIIDARASGAVQLSQSLGTSCGMWAGGHRQP